MKYNINLSSPSNEEGTTGEGCNRKKDFSLMELKEKSTLFFIFEIFIMNVS